MVTPTPWIPNRSQTIVNINSASPGGIFAATNPCRCQQTHPKRQPGTIANSITKLAGESFTGQFRPLSFNLLPTYKRRVSPTRVVSADSLPGADSQYTLRLSRTFPWPPGEFLPIRLAFSSACLPLSSPRSG